LVDIVVIGTMIGNYERRERWVLQVAVNTREYKRFSVNTV